MAFANTNVTDIIATTIQHRSRKIADNVTNNNALLKELKKSGRVRPFGGGDQIFEELSFANNSNAGWYSGYDVLPTGTSDVISAAEFAIRQAAVPVTMSGLEGLQNAGKEQFIDLMAGRLDVAESTLANLISTGVYSDGTAAGGKQIEGLEAMIPMDPTAAPYAGIDGATFTFWQNAVYDGTAGGVTAGTIQGLMNGLYAQLVRGADVPNLIPCDSTFWETYLASLQAQQRFTNTNSADAGFAMIDYMTAKVCLDGGIYDGGYTGSPAGTAFFLNTKYMSYRPHRNRNMVPLSPNKRYATNQDAEVQILAWAGNLTCRGRKFQGRFDMNG